MFLENVGTRGSADTTSITAYRVLISFYGNTSFISNRGGGVSLLSSRMDVRGSVKFDKNTAVFGAGVAMSGRSLVSMAQTFNTALVVIFSILYTTSISQFRYCCIMIHMLSSLTML